MLSQPASSSNLQLQNTCFRLYRPLVHSFSYSDCPWLILFLRDNVGRPTVLDWHLTICAFKILYKRASMRWARHLKSGSFVLFVTSWCSFSKFNNTILILSASYRPEYHFLEFGWRFLWVAIASMPDIRANWMKQTWSVYWLFLLYIHSCQFNTWTQIPGGILLIWTNVSFQCGQIDKDKMDTKGHRDGLGCLIKVAPNISGIS